MVRHSRSHADEYPDAQILLSLAVSLNFVVRSRCTLSLYHLRIALNLILIGCTNFMLAFTIVRNYWRAPIAGFVRIIYLGAALGFLGNVLRLQVVVGEQPEQEPSTSTNYSMILLSADCFLNETLIKTVENSTAGAVGIVGQLQQISWGSVTESFWFFILLFLFAVSLIMRFAQGWMYGYEGPPRRTPDYHSYVKGGLRRWVRWWALPAWAAVICGGSAGLYVKMARHVFNLRGWVAQTGWIEGDEFSSNPEDDFFGLGQTAAMVATLAIIMAGMDKWHPKKKEKND